MKNFFFPVIGHLIILFQVLLLTKKIIRIITEYDIANDCYFGEKFRMKVYSIKDALSEHNSEYCPAGGNASNNLVETVVHRMCGVQQWAT